MNKPHIYRVINTVNGKEYIGQHDGSKAHYFAGGKAINQAIRKYGKAAFRREIVVSGDCTKEELDALEIHYIAHFQTYMPTYPDKGYNLTLGGGGKRGDIASEETKRLRSINSANQRAVVQFDLEGNKVAAYRTILEAAKATSTPHSSIYRCADGKLRQANGYLWLFAVDYADGKQPVLAKIKYLRAVGQYDADGNLIATYPSTVAAAKANNFNRSAIANALAGTVARANGFHWRYS